MTQGTHTQWMGDGFHAIPDEQEELSPELEASLKSILEAMNVHVDSEEGVSQDELSLFLEEATKIEKEHAGIQHTLVIMGKTLGYDVYIPPSDRSHVIEGQKLDALTLPELPAFEIAEHTRQTLEAVDVVWLHKNGKTVEIKCLFEVENTGSLFSGLPRLAKLAEMCRCFRFDSYIVTSDENEGALLSQLKNMPIGEMARARTRYILHSSLNAAKRVLDENGLSLAALNKIASFPFR